MITPTMKNPDDYNIHLPANVWRKWKADLLSGEYVKGTGILQSADGKFCCLGVLQHGIAGKVEKHCTGISRSIPSRDWVSRHGIIFYNAFRNSPVMVEQVPFIKSKHAYIDQLNDMTGISIFGLKELYTFKDIVDMLETEIYFTDEENPL